MSSNYISNLGEEGIKIIGCCQEYERGNPQAGDYSLLVGGEGYPSGEKSYGSSKRRVC